MKRSTNLPVPAYYKLQMLILGEIEKGQWKPGEKIPTERVLAETHRVSIGTVKKAILNLTFEGYLYRIQGKGTFVAGTYFRRESLRYYRLLEYFDDEEAQLSAKLLDLHIIKSLAPASQYLGINLKTDLYEVKRLFTTKQTPVVYTISYFPRTIFKNLEEIPKTLFEKVPLYEAIESRFGLPTIYNRELFGAVHADTEAANALKIPQGTPVLLIEMLSFTYKDKPYEYRRSYFFSKERKLFREI